MKQVGISSKRGLANEELTIYNARSFGGKYAVTVDDIPQKFRENSYDIIFFLPEQVIQINTVI